MQTKSLNEIARGKLAIHWSLLLCMALLLSLWASPARAASPSPQRVNDDPVFVGAGDIADCPNGKAAETANLIKGITGTVFTLGDNAYGSGTPEQFAQCYESTWGQFKDRTKPVPGNHDYLTAGAAGYYGYFGTTASPQESACLSNCLGYYSYDLGAWHIIALNSEIDHSVGSAQLTWLKKDLEDHQTTCTAAYWHKPLFTSGVHQDDGDRSSHKTFWDVLYQYGADVVLNGHDHEYERFAPQNPDGQRDDAAGIREFVVGTGGTSLREFGTMQPNSEFSKNDTHGVLKMTLSPSSYTWEFVSIDSTIVDQGTATCVEASTFVGAGDIADCPSGKSAETANLLDGIAGTVFTLGDNVYTSGTASEFSNCYDTTWGRHKARTKPVPGNHDYHTSGAAGYFGYFGDIASPRETGCISNCMGYYSYNVGTWHIIALNSEISHTVGSPQIEWLRNDLETNQTTCTLAYWHKPLFTSGDHQVDGDRLDHKTFWDVLYQYGADVVLNGHDHEYERFAPQSPDGQLDTVTGIREFVVGTGGTALRNFDVIQPNSDVRDNTAHGVLKLRLLPTSYAWEFVPIAGETFTDTGATACVPASNRNNRVYMPIVMS